ncbi:MAG: tetratricopeptide repeat protein [Candidatus Eisenbacteria bacterium]|nr:tetratricopeptide repeat protein [Candidatus Eisenbacteria bacterium]
MTAPRKCWECGAAIPEGAGTCPDCGLPVQEGAKAGAARPEAPAPAPKPAPVRRPAVAGTAAGNSRSLQVGLIGVVIGAALGAGGMYMVHSMQPAQNAQQTAEDNGRMPADMPPGSGQAPALPEDMNAKIAMLKEAVDKTPDNFTHIVGLANMMYDAGKFKEAIPYYEKGLKLQPDNLDVRVDLATSKFQVGDGHTALDELDKVLAKDPHHANAMYNRGVIEKSLGNQEEADKAWRDYVEHHPEGPKAAKIKADLASGATKSRDYRP